MSLTAQVAPEIYRAGPEFHLSGFRLDPQLTRKEHDDAVLIKRKELRSSSRVWKEHKTELF